MLLAVAGGANKVSRLASDMMILLDSGLQHCELNLRFSSKFAPLTKKQTQTRITSLIWIYMHHIYITLVIFQFNTYGTCQRYWPLDPLTAFSTF
jgi:hypothetical protein